MVQRHGVGGAFAVEAGRLGLLSGGRRRLPEAVRGNARVQEAYLGSVLADQQAAAAGHGH